MGRASAAAREYAAAWSDAVRSLEDGGGFETAAGHVRRAGAQLEALCAGLTELHEQLDRPPVMPHIGGYGPDEVCRIVRAAIAFRKAVTWAGVSVARGSELAELCAAVDGKQDSEGTR